VYDAHVRRSAAPKRALAVATLAVLALVGAVMACSEETVPECPDSCADFNPCTIDHCVDGTCFSDPVAAGFSCSDSDACNGVEVCDGNATCLAGEAVLTNDHDPCTTDACDPTSGAVTHERKAECVVWEALPSAGAPVARDHHSAVWTGTEMLVWGGSIEAEPFVTNTGAAYDPALRTWREISTVGAPAPRHSHAAVWTGSRMLVWGGYGASAYEASGGLYDPATDTWQSIATAGAPTGRTDFAYAWNGAALLVSGGLGPGVLGDGATYTPATDAWAPISVGLSPRFGHTATALSDGRVLLWGGTNLFDWLNDGVVFDPSSGPTPTASGGPSHRQSQAAVLGGDVVYVWGGWNGGPYLGDGSVFDPSGGPGGAWTPMPDPGAPTARTDFVSFWTGDELFVWGGCAGETCATLLGDGALYRPSASGGAWTEIALGDLAPRRDAAGVWTGDRALIWGGRGQGGKRLGGGAESVIAGP